MQWLLLVSNNKEETKNKNSVFQISNFFWRKSGNQLKLFSRMTQIENRLKTAFSRALEHLALKLGVLSKN